MSTWRGSPGRRPTPRHPRGTRAGDASTNNGCPVYAFRYVDVEVQDDAGILAHRAVARRADGTGAPITYFVGGQDRLSFGHSNCGGPTPLRWGETYTVSLAALDLAGNEAQAPGDPVEVAVPDPHLGARWRGPQAGPAVDPGASCDVPLAVKLLAATGLPFLAGYLLVSLWLTRRRARG
jgi:hypothetical protein